MVGSRRPRVLAVLPNYMAARNFLLTGASSAVADQAELVCWIPEALCTRLATANRGRARLAVLPTDPSGLRKRMAAIALALWPGLGYGGLAYRFNELNGFAGHRFKAAFTPEQQEREVAAGNFVAPRYGWPRPRSRFFYRYLRRLYWQPWWINRVTQAQIDKLRPDILYLGHIQTPGVRDIILAARRRKIPVIGTVASWDQPTTKGPVPAHLDRYLVQSTWMKEKLVTYHCIASTKIAVTGWPQMDVYAEAEEPARMADCRAQFGIASEAKVILFGLYSPRLGSHEPEVARRLLAEIERRPAANWHLLIRPHPRATGFAAAFKEFDGSPRVSFVTEGFDDLRQLRDQIRISAAVVTSFGSLALDAVALHRPALYFSDGGDSSWARMEHLASVIETGAVPVAQDVSELIRLLERTLTEPGDLAAGSCLRALHVEPLNGEAGARVADAILATKEGPS